MEQRGPHEQSTPSPWNGGFPASSAAPVPLPTHGLATPTMHHMYGMGIPPPGGVIPPVTPGCIASSSPHAGGASLAEMQQVLSQQMAQLHQLQQSAASRTPQPAGPVPSLPAESSRGPKRAAPDEGGAARPPEVAGPLPVHAAQPAPSGGPPSELRPPPPGIDPSVGDWPCVCGNWNWARRSQCNKCQSPKGSGSRLMTAGVLAAAASGSLGGADGGAADGEKQLRRKQLLAAATPSDGSVVPLYLGNMSKPSHYQMSHHNAGPSAGVKAVPPTIDPSVGDWLCTCGNWNWAKRHECNMCRGSKEAANIGAKRTGAAGGFIEYDQSEGERRKMRALEAQQQVQARKAEKRKCEFCKRYERRGVGG